MLSDEEKEIFWKKRSVCSNELTALARRADPEVNFCDFQIERGQTDSDDIILEFVNIKFANGSKKLVNVSGCSVGAMSISVLEKIIY